MSRPKLMLTILLSCLKVFNVQAENALGNFVTIPAGTYEMGSLEEEPNRQADEQRHIVKLTSFQMGETAVTQEQYVRIMGSNPSKFKDPMDCPKSFKLITIKQKNISVCANHPVENVNWNDAILYAALISEKDPHYIYRLPTEAQQEVAFRGGTDTAFVSGNSEEGIGKYLWYSGNSEKQTHPVKSKSPNAFGIYRSSVWEWSNDWYSKDYQGSSGIDPAGPSTGSLRVLRGGGWSRNAIRSRSAFRAHDIPELRNELGSLGFRVVRINRSSVKQHPQNSIGNFLTIPGGVYEIGSPDTEPNRQADEHLHKVQLSSFEIAQTAVTQERYASVTGTNPSHFKHPTYCPNSFKIITQKQKKIPVCADFPVENVNWNDAIHYALLESTLDKKFVYSLPTEAQQEVAFRGGTHTAYVSGTDESGIADYIWFSDSDYFEKQTHPVTLKRANAYGIYHSGVWEWSNDWYNKEYQDSQGLNPKGPPTGIRRVLRGCSRVNVPKDCRSAFRNDLLPTERRLNGLVGLRLVRKKTMPIETRRH